MLAPIAGRSAFRQLKTSSCMFTHRVDHIALTCARVYTSNNTSNSFAIPLRPRQPTLFESIGRRFYAPKPASKPKASTGSTATRSRKTTGKGGRAKPAKRATKPKAKSRAKPKAKPKGKKSQRRAKKEKTEEQLIAEKVKKGRATIRALRVTALKFPKKLPDTVYTILTTEKGKEAKGLAPREASSKYKQLLPEEREHYNHVASENKARNNAALTTWVDSNPPEDIRKANNARRRLARLGVKGYNRQIKDFRQVKRPVTARSLFLKDRYASGDMRGLGIGEASRLISREWQELPQDQKEPYFAAQAESRTQYVRNVRNVYHREVRPRPARASRS